MIDASDALLVDTLDADIAGEKLLLAICRLIEPAYKIVQILPEPLGVNLETPCLSNRKPFGIDGLQPPQVLRREQLALVAYRCKREFDELVFAVFYTGGQGMFVQCNRMIKNIVVELWNRCEKEPSLLRFQNKMKKKNNDFH
jgi:hypothetical protein